MGYRLRLGEINKCVADKFRHKTYKELTNNKEGSFSLVCPKHYKQLYELGKHVSYEKGNKRFYTKFNIQKYEYDFFILSKEGLRYIIEDYAENTRIYYNELFEKAAKLKLNPTKLSPVEIDELVAHFNFMKMEWQNDFVKPYWLDEEKTDGGIVRSWKMQYAIFNLVYIYRTFDWEKKYLIYSGW